MYALLFCFAQNWAIYQSMPILVHFWSIFYQNGLKTTVSKSIPVHRPNGTRQNGMNPRSIMVHGPDGTRLLAFGLCCEHSRPASNCTQAVASAWDPGSCYLCRQAEVAACSVTLRSRQGPGGISATHQLPVQTGLG